MKYEIINPSDKCYIYSNDVRLAQLVGFYLGNGMYGLKDENGESVLHVFQDLLDAIEMNEEEASKYIEENKKALIDVFRSFEYVYERTSVNNIGKRAEYFADMLEKQLSESKGE